MYGDIGRGEAEGHWLKIERKFREATAAAPGDVVSLEIAPAAVEPEPKAPAELRKALAAADAKARAVWTDITPVARRDWIQWIESAKQETTRVKRISLRPQTTTPVGARRGD